MTTKSGLGSIASRRPIASARFAAGSAAREPPHQVRVTEVGDPHVPDGSNWRRPGSARRARQMGAAGTMASMIGRLHHLILDCPDPLALATFYSELLGQPITYRSDNFVVVAENDTTSGLAFQLAPDHQPPDWPDPARPQQMHFDVMVEDLAASAPACWPSARGNSRARTSTPTRLVIRSA